ncbi:hypothetical protein LXA43DRAFT_901116, partial [Ganoderma leucocontextum]
LACSASRTTPEVLRCPDGQFRRAIFSTGPFIADYPEQVYVSGITSGWAPKSVSTCILIIHSESKCRLRFPAFIYYFPRADMHELLLPDILHQLVKGTFKDSQLASWVQEYIKFTAASEREAKEILHNIDRRYLLPFTRCYDDY